MGVPQIIKIVGRFERYGRIVVRRPEGCKYLDFITADRDNFFETCRFLVLFQELKQYRLYRILLDFVLKSQRLNGFWMIDPTALYADGDVRHDLVYEPTKRAIAVAYANKEVPEAMKSFRTGFELLFGGGSEKENKCRCISISLSTIRYYERVGILRDYREHDCIKRVYENAIDYIRKHRSYTNSDVEYYLEIAYRLNPEDEYVLRRIENLSKKCRRRGYLLALVNKTITPELFKQKYYIDDLLWLPIKESEVKNLDEIIELLDKMEVWRRRMFLSKVYLKYFLGVLEKVKLGLSEEIHLWEDLEDV